MSLTERWSGVGRWFRQFFFGNLAETNGAELLGVTDAEGVEPMITGEDLISRIFETIRLRRSVLVTGPRGCGKSYCSEQAIRRARDQKVIGGWRFLQGNREIPRDILSEDLLVIGPSGKPELLRALAIRPLPGQQPPPELAARFPEWPAIPTQEVRPNDDPRRHWRAIDWIVLYLDEINRFGDGLLDSLLSLTEEGKIVRRGEDYYIPMIVVATANPPGYDATAKKLSPPLQARIARSFRVAQPRFEDLVDPIIAARLRELRSRYTIKNASGVEVPDERYQLSPDLARLAAAATLCLWGDPKSGAQGNYFLTRATRLMLQGVMDRDQAVRRAMRTLSTLLTFGPDARAVQDWIGAAVGLAFSKGERVGEEHLLATAVDVLGHKVRESFNEGAEPAKSSLKEFCVAEVTRCVFTNPLLRELFVPPIRIAAQMLSLAADEDARTKAVATLRRHEEQLPPARRQPWVRALSTLPSNLTEKDLNGWRRTISNFQAMTPEQTFFNQRERNWLASVLRDPTLRGDELAATLVSTWPYDRERQLDELLAGRPVLKIFAAALRNVQRRHRDTVLLDFDDYLRWLDTLYRVLGPDKLETTALDVELWEGFVCLTLPDRSDLSTNREPSAVLRLLTESLQEIQRAAANGQRCARALGRLRSFQEVPFANTAMALAVGDPTPETRARLTGVLIDHLHSPVTVWLGEGRGIPAVCKRLSAWLRLLSRLGELPSQRTEIPGWAAKQGVLTSAQVFVSLQERQVMLALLGLLAKEVPALTALEYGLSGCRFSTATLLESHFPTLRSPEEAQRQQRPRETLAKLLDELSTDDVKFFFDDFQEGSPRCRNSLKALANLTLAAAAATPTADELTICCWDAAFELTAPSTGSSNDELDASRVERSFGLLVELLLRLKTAGRAIPATLLESLPKAQSRYFLEAGRMFRVRPRLGAILDPVGPRRILSWLRQLIHEAGGWHAELPQLGFRWLHALAGLDLAKDQQSFLSTLRGNGIFLADRLGTFQERDWLLANCQQYDRAKCVPWVTALSFDSQAMARYAVPNNPAGQQFFTAVVDWLAVQTLPHDSRLALLAACRRLAAEFTTGRSKITETVRKALKQLGELRVLTEETACALLQRGLQAVSPPSARVQQILAQLARECSRTP